MLTQHSRKKVEGMDILPTVHDSLGFRGLGGDGVAEMNCELADKGERCGVGYLLVYSVKF